MTRDKYPTRAYLLTDISIADFATAAIHNAPIDKENPIEVVIRERVKGRGLDANAYYWLRLNEISEQAYINGRTFDSETWHEFAKKNIMNEIVKNKKGDEVSKHVELPDGSFRTISTTQLEKSCFAEYVTMVEAYGASIGVMFSADPRKANY